MRFQVLWLAFICICITVVTAPVWAQDGADLYRKHCDVCHENGQGPSRAVLREMSPEQVLVTLETGSMNKEGAERSVAERRAIAEFISGRAFDTEPVSPMPKSAFCDSSAPKFRDSLAGPSWNGWGVTVANTRFQTAAAAGLAAEDVPRLKLKWAFGFPGDTSASAQPAIMGGRLYVGSWGGNVYSLDAKTGCIHWTYAAASGVRTAISIGKGNNGELTLYFGDLSGNVYAVHAATGKLLWKVRVDDHPLARVTGSPTLYSGRLYVPLASREESHAGDEKYECCKFRGSVVALDALTGKQIWKTYAIPQEPRPTQKTKVGTQMWGPAGVGIWVAPTIDPKRNLLYVGSGNDYSIPATTASDSIIAFDMKSGKIRWVLQTTSNDIWNGNCRRPHRDPATCPDPDAPDFDFAASPVLVQLKGGRHLLIAANKSGVVYALDPDHEGKVVWQRRIGKGGTQGGVLFGPAADSERVYVALSDFGRFKDMSVDPSVGGGMFALDLATGQVLWSTPAPPCGERKPCSPAQAAAVSAIPGIAFSGSVDGYMRAYSTRDGKIVWEYDTVREFTTLNGVKAKGGSINNAGPTIADGMMFTNSGYSHHSAVIPGNVLLAFAVE